MIILSYIYAFIVKIRNFLYDNNFLEVKKLDNVEIVCIGNIVVGGAGKTPAVHYFVRKYLEVGKRVAILSRGYKGKRERDPFLVRDYEKMYGSVSESGDEAYLHALTFKVPVVVAKSRYDGAKFLKEKFDVEAIVMDDGYQHRKLYRDKNVLLIDATNPFGGEKHLPAGKLRESLAEMKRADEIILTKTNFVSEEKIKEILKKIERYNKNKCEIELAIYEKKYFYNNSGEKMGLSEIEGKKVLIFSSIANPAVFHKTVEALGPVDIKSLDFPDHYAYKMEDLEKIYAVGKNFDFILTTEKDMVKIGNKRSKLYFLKMEFDIINN